jgi:LssY C-terminus
MFTTRRGSVASAILERVPAAVSQCLQSAGCLLFLLPCAALGQQLISIPKPIVVAEGTPVQLQLAETISSAHARKGDRVEFGVLEDVNQSGMTVIRAGARAWGSVTEVRNKRPLGMPGRLTLEADSVELANGEVAALRASGMEFKGHRHLVRMIAEMIGAGLIYLPAAPAMMLTRGGDSYALKTSETTGYLNDNVTIAAGGLSPAAPTQHGLDAMLNFLPPRVLDGHGREGDMVNLVFVAPQNELQQAFEHAGWTSVDMTKHVIAWHLLCHGTHYARLPMAHFFLFGRSQDFSFSLPDPLSLLSRRHHIRIWKTDYLVDNTPVWIAAATHDVSIAMHRMRVTHRIDPQVDAERDFIGDNLSGTQLVARTEYVPSQQPVFQATTAGGQPYYSDSRILLVKLTPVPGGAQDTSAQTPRVPAKTSESKTPEKTSSMLLPPAAFVRAQSIGISATPRSAP